MLLLKALQCPPGAFRLLPKFPPATYHCLDPGFCGSVWPVLCHLSLSPYSSPMLHPLRAENSRALSYLWALLMSVSPPQKRSSEPSIPSKPLLATLSPCSSDVFHDTQHRLLLPAYCLIPHPVYALLNSRCLSLVQCYAQGGVMRVHSWL